MPANDPGGSRTRDLRIKSQNTDSSRHNDLARSPSDSGAVRDRVKPKSSGQSATNPTTSRAYVETPENDLRNALRIIELGRLPSTAPARFNLISSEIAGVHVSLTAALEKLEAARSARLSVIRQMLQRARAASAVDPTLVDSLDEMEQTNVELTGSPNALIVLDEEAADVVR